MKKLLAATFTAVLVFGGTLTTVFAEAETAVISIPLYRAESGTSVSDNVILMVVLGAVAAVALGTLVVFTINAVLNRKHYKKV